MKVINPIKFLFYFLPLVIMANFSIVSVSHGAEIVNAPLSESGNIDFQSTSGSGDGEEKPEEEEPDC